MERTDEDEPDYPWSDVDDDPSSDDPLSDDEVEVVQEQPRTSATYPFDNVAQGLLAMTFLRRSVTSQRKRDSFLLCLDTPQCGVNSRCGSVRTMDRRLALLPHPLELHAATPCRVRDFAGEEKKLAHDEEVGCVRRRKLRLYRTVELDVVAHCPVDHVKRDLADPILAPGLRYGLEDAPPGGPTEWNQTPFAHEHLLFQQLLSFRSGGVEYRKGDFVLTRGAGWQVGSVDDLEYRPASDEKLRTVDVLHDDPLREDLRPRLWLRIRRTAPGRDFHQNQQNDICALPQLSSKELVVSLDDDDDEWRLADDVLKPVDVINIPPKPSGNRQAMRERNTGLQEAQQAVRVQGRRQSYVCRYSYTRYHVAPPARRSMCASAGMCPYVPFVLRVWSEHLDNVDDRVLWYGLFVDKFHMHNSQRDGGYNAVYMQVFNYSKTFRNSQSTLRVLAVLPPGADLPSASRSWQVKLRVASESGFKAWSFVDNREMQYYLLPCLLIADHMQQVETLCHLGNKAKRNGRSTWTKDTERCNVTTDPRDHRVLRRWAQTEVVKAQQCRRAELLGFVVGSEKDKALRTVSGIDHRAHSETTGGPLCDPHLACTWDPCHLLEHGYLRFIVRVVLKSLPKKLRIVFRSVLRDFRWPKGVSRPVMGWTKGDVFPKSQISWDFTKKVVMVSMVRLCGLWPDGGGDVKDLYMFLCRFGRWVFQIMGPVPVHRHTALQREVDELVVLGERLIGDEYENKTALLGKWDRPNLLGL